MNINYLQNLSHQCQQFLKITIPSFLKNSARELKIVTVAGIALTLISGLAYVLYRKCQRHVKPENSSQGTSPQKVEEFSNKIFYTFNSSATDDINNWNEIQKVINNTKLEEEINSSEKGTKIEQKEEEINNSDVIIKETKEISTSLEIDFKTHFRELEERTGEITKKTEFLYPNDCCAFVNILCPIASRVKVSGEQLKESTIKKLNEDGFYVKGNQEDFYLNANHIHLAGFHFIAGQHPSFSDPDLFWRACKEQKVGLIIDLTNKNDMKKGVQDYAPISTQAEQTPKKLIISQNNEHKRLDKLSALQYDINIAEIEKGVDHKKDDCNLLRLHYLDWDDHSGASESDIDQIIKVVEEVIEKGSGETSIFIHCRAGVGRSGTIIVACALARLIKQEKVNAGNLVSKIDELIMGGRQQRGPGFVQTEEQLACIYKWASKKISKS